MFPTAPTRPLRRPWAYFVTFACYGTRLHGNSTGSVDRFHNLPGAPYLPRNWRREAFEQRIMHEEAFVLDEERRRVVLAALEGACQAVGWSLRAAHVRTNHVHAVVEAEGSREEILRRLKARASSDLRGLDPGRTKRWAKHGSVRELWTPEAVDSAIEYVVKCQGEPLAVMSRPNLLGGPR